MTQGEQGGAACPRCAGVEDHARWCADAHLGSPSALAETATRPGVYTPAAWAGGAQAADDPGTEAFRRWQVGQVEYQTSLLERQLAMLDRIRGSLVVLVVFLVIVPLIVGFLLSRG